MKTAKSPVTDANNARMTAMQRILDNFPDDLIRRPQWVNWKLEQRGERMTKVPYQPNGRKADSTNPATWSDFQSVKLACARDDTFTGIGFVFTKEDPYVGIDLDKCRDPVSGVVEPWATAIINRFDTYAELSPSGKGFHIIGRGKLPTKGRKKDHIEMYESGRYFTVTGDHYGQSPFEATDIQTPLTKLHTEVFGKTKTPAKNKQAANDPSSPTKPIPNASTDQAVIDTILASHDAATFLQFQAGNWAALGYPSQSEGDLAFAGMLARHAGSQAEQIDRIFRGSGMMRDKWDEMRGTQTYGEMTIAKAMEGLDIASPMNQFMAQMNQRFALIAIGNKLRILDATDGPNNIKFLSRPDFGLQTANLPSPAKSTSAATVWQSSPQRRYYSSLVFSPDRDVPGAYNTWRGFSVEPRPGTCSLFWQLVERAICSGSFVLYEYVRRYFAHMIQCPWERPEVSLVLRGGQGVGKNTFVEAMASLIAHHYRQVNSMDQITGRFNGHMQNVVLLHANEATWGGSKADQGKLKAMVTDPKVPIEMKGLDIIEMDNFLRLIISSNEKWPVPIDIDDRRFLVLDVHPIYKQDQKFFAALHDELNDGGREALMHDLTTEDISSFSPRNKPASPFGADIKIRSAESPIRWLYDLLNDNKMSGLPTSFPQVGAPLEVDKDTLHFSYLDWSKSSPDRYPLPRDQFFKTIRKILGTTMTDSRPAATTGHFRGRKVVLFSIVHCRMAFENAIGERGNIKWEPV